MAVEDFQPMRKSILDLAGSTNNKDHTMGERMKNCDRKWYHNLCAFLLSAICTYVKIMRGLLDSPKSCYLFLPYLTSPSIEHSSTVVVTTSVHHTSHITSILKYFAHLGSLFQDISDSINNQKSCYDEGPIIFLRIV